MKLLNRSVVLFLIPCLLMDAALGQCMAHNSAQTIIRLNPEFDSQAIVAHLVVGFRHLRDWVAIDVSRTAEREALADGTFAGRLTFRHERWDSPPTFLSEDVNLGSAAGDHHSELSFSQNVEILNRLLDNRMEVVGRITDFLPGRIKDDQDATKHLNGFARMFERAVFSIPDLPAGANRFNKELESRSRADGFVMLKSYAKLDAYELFKYWVVFMLDEHGSSSVAHRVRWAQGIFSVFIKQQLHNLALRVSDDGPENAMGHLEALQKLLDRLNAGRYGSAPAAIRDAHWLFLTGQSLPSNEVRPYIDMYDQITRSFDPSNQLEFHKIHARLIGQHIRADLFQRARDAGTPINAAIFDGLRYANAIDYVLLIRDLNALMEAYETATHDGRDADRIELADRILQGMSADPERFLLRHDLLAAYSMIEKLFLERNPAGRVQETGMGREHAEQLETFHGLVGRLAAALEKEAPVFDPSQFAYSPFGHVYTFPAPFMDGMAERALFPGRVGDFSIEDAYASSKDPNRLAWAGTWGGEYSWVKVDEEPNRTRYRYSRDHANYIFRQLTSALHRRAHAADAQILLSPKGRYFVVSGEEITRRSMRGYSLPQGAGVTQATLQTTQTKPEMDAILLTRDEFEQMRAQGNFLAVCLQNGAWYGLTKDFLTTKIAQGQDIIVVGVPAAAVEMLKKTWPEVIVLPGPSTAYGEHQGPAGGVFGLWAGLIPKIGLVWTFILGSFVESVVVGTLLQISEGPRWVIMPLLGLNYVLHAFLGVIVYDAEINDWTVRRVEWSKEWKFSSEFLDKVVINGTIANLSLMAIFSVFLGYPWWATLITAIVPHVIPTFFNANNWGSSVALDPAVQPESPAAPTQPTSAAAPAKVFTPPKAAAPATPISILPVKATPRAQPAKKSIPAVFINGASYEELVSIPGIGSARATSIWLAQRHGPIESFKHLNEILSEIRRQWDGRGTEPKALPSNFQESFRYDQRPPSKVVPMVQPAPSSRFKASREDKHRPGDRNLRGILLPFAVLLSSFLHQGPAPHPSDKALGTAA